ncbi:MAG: putative glycoprotein [Inari rhabdovirus]|uniref:Glycoprotein n=1 Tax=Inari rhabdovirus TaxID=2980584 RepID=A0AAE9TAV0_9RHAB|nr:MAG: putative glycoprotein [Inari rhabdovirus]
MISNTVSAMLAVLTLLITIQRGCTFRKAGSESGLFYGPTSRDILWTPIQPKEIWCNQRMSPAAESGDKSLMITGAKLTHTDSQSVAGYLCSKTQWDVICSEGLFGGKTVKHQLQPMMPTEPECLDAVRKYRTNHNLNLGFPPENCGWWSTNTVSSTNIHVAETTVKMDPYLLTLIDQRFPSGFCQKLPCPLSTLDKIFMNRTNLKNSCPRKQVIELYRRNQTSPDFYSTELLATTLLGSCQLMVCGDSGLRLSTGEWVSLDARSVAEQAWFKSYPKCPDHSIVNDVSLVGIISHLEKLSKADDSFRMCYNVKEKLMAGEPISREDLSFIAHSAPTAGPVYRLNNGTVEAGFSEYQTMLSVNPIAEGISHEAIGRHPVTHLPFLWKHWVKSTPTSQDGPNGIVSIAGYLLNPLVGLDSPGLYRDQLELTHNHTLEHPITTAGAVGHTLDWVFNPKSTSASLSSILPTSFNFFRPGPLLITSFCLLFLLIVSYIVKIVYPRFRPYKKYTQKGEPSVGYAPQLLRL